jgi:hypothetical protein
LENEVVVVKEPTLDLSQKKNSLHLSHILLFLRSRTQAYSMPNF